MIICIVPAAGESKRFPWNKLLYTYHDKPLIAQTIMNIAESPLVDLIILVTGFQSREIESLMRNLGLSNVVVVYNPDYGLGMSSSVKSGIRYIIKEGYSFDGVMVNPGDVAWVHPGIYSLVATRFYDNMDRYLIVVASYMGRRGHPVVFNKALTEDLLNISEEKKGLKELFQKYSDKILDVDTNYPGVILDLDSILDLNRVKQAILK